MTKHKERLEQFKKDKYWEGHPSEYAETFVAFLRKRNFAGLLTDVGCGKGQDVAVFTAAGISTIGVDCSANEIKLGKSKLPACTFEIQSAENFTFKDATIGAIFMVNVIHLVDQEKAFQEFMRVLEPGGYIFIHFDLELGEQDGSVYYRQDERDIAEFIAPFDLIEERRFERTDTLPKVHTHKVLELILQKPK